MTDLDYYLLEVLLDRPATVTVSLQGLKAIQTTVDIVQKLFTIAAIIIGAIWTYFNFFSGRTYRMRLELTVSGKVVTLNGSNHLAADMSLKNVGLSKVEIEQKGSGLRVLSYEVPVGTRSIVSATWEDLTAFSVFDSHRWIEPGETVKEQRLVLMPANGRLALQLRLHIVSKRLSWTAVDTVLSNTHNTRNTEGGEG
jgi:hypothetical protein